MKTLAQHSLCRAMWLSTPLGSGAYRPWLAATGSLTQHLQARCQSFTVTQVMQQRGMPLADESVPLGLRPQQQALLREVYLCCDGQPVVFAHSVLPRHSLRGEWQALRRLGAKPLGAALFTHAGVLRTPLSYRKLLPRHPLYRRAVSALRVAPPALWARRSVFMLRNNPILVTEIFLPGVLAL